MGGVKDGASGSSRTVECVGAAGRAVALTVGWSRETWVDVELFLGASSVRENAGA